VERVRANLVFISSMSGKIPAAGAACTPPRKFGMRGFASSLRDELGGTGVGVTTVFPGSSATRHVRRRRHEAPAGIGTRSPEQVARAVVRGIERNRSEIEVAPLLLRSSGWLAGISPSAVTAIARRLGSATSRTNSPRSSVLSA